MRRRIKMKEETEGKKDRERKEKIKRETVEKRRAQWERRSKTDGREDKVRDHRAEERREREISHERREEERAQWSWRKNEGGGDKRTGRRSDDRRDTGLGNKEDERGLAGERETSTRRSRKNISRRKRGGGDGEEVGSSVYTRGREVLERDAEETGEEYRCFCRWGMLASAHE